MRPMFGLMNVIFTASVSQQPVLLVENFPARDHVGGRGHADVKRRKRDARAEHTRSDRAPTIESLASLVDALSEFLRPHTPLRENRSTVPVVGIEPPGGRQQAVFGQ